MNQRKGLFIAFEGIDGTGKTTQCKHLVERLQAEQYDVVPVRSPGTTQYGKRIREWLLNQNKLGVPSLTGEDELWLMVMDRVLLLQEVIEPALAAGKVVIADRWIPSTYVYQGLLRTVSMETIRQIHERLQIRHPDVYIHLRVTTPESHHEIRQRIQARHEVMTPHDRIALERGEAMEAIYQAILEPFGHHGVMSPPIPSTSVVVHNLDTFQPEDRLASEIFAEVRNALHIHCVPYRYRK